ncbi:MAG TPA: GNAT family N-acetyltransferase [Hyphomicrobiales bacterium]|nr:GNAT family N-acetyltransferase [Hyphomicrobiales bacterium]
MSDDSQRGRTRRLFGATVVLRAVNAALAFALQIGLARWLGGEDYGGYVYAWVWLLVLSNVAGIGLPSAAQRFIPEYAGRGDAAALRGFLRWGRLLAVGVAAGLTLVAIAVVWFDHGLVEAAMRWPLVLALACLPAMVLMDVQDGIARSYDWADLGLVPTFLVRPVLTLLALAALALFAAPATAEIAMAATLAALWATAAFHALALNRRLAGRVGRGAVRADPRGWLAVALPVVVVEGFYALLTYTDVLVLDRFADSAEVGIYFAATKIMAVMSFIYFAAAASSAHRFAHFAAAGDRVGLSRAAHAAARRTFWPSLGLAIVLIALGEPLLWLFGPEFEAGFVLLPVLAVGLLARAAIGPAERLLSMTGQQRAGAVVYGGVFVLNMALNILLIPRLGALGAATATSLAFVAETACLHAIARRRLGLDLFVFAGGEAVRRPVVGGIAVEDVDAAALARHLPAWEALAANAVEPNVFYEPAVALPALRLRRHRGTRAILAWSADAGGRRLVGLWLVRRSRWRYLVPLPVGVVVPSYAPFATPLLDRAAADRAAAALIADAAGAGTMALAVPFLGAGPAASALARAAAAAGLPARRFAVHHRAALRHGSEAKLDHLVRHKTVKELGRLRRRLGDEGIVTLAVAARPGEVEPALEAFLGLERAGWKGRRGTALAARDDEGAFVRAAAAALAPRGGMRVVLLRCDGRPIAGAIVLASRGRAFYFKTAYDETLARFSPGTLLTRELTAHLLADPELRLTDSLAVPRHPMIERLWPDRIEMFDWLVAAHPEGPLPFALIAGLEAARRALLDAIRPLARLLYRRF